MVSKILLKKIPIPILVVITVIVNIILGSIVSIMNITFSEMTQGFRLSHLVELAIIYVGIALFDGLYKIVEKGLRMKIINAYYRKYLEKVLNSHMRDIQKISTGKVFDAVKDLSMYNTYIVSGMLSFIPIIIPFGTLIINEWNENPICSVISLICVSLAAIMISVTDRMFRWSTEAKEKKGTLQGISVDNFMNVKTLKYLGQKKFASKRLLDAQNEAFPYMVNTKQIIWFRIADLIGWMPLIINVLICKNNIEMIALIILCDKTLEAMRDQLVYISELIMERKAQLNVIKTLDGSDCDERKNLEDALILNNVSFDYGKDSTKFTIKNLTFRKGERYHITGESGEGKSSLANLIVGSIVPTSGKVDQIHTYYVWQETECLDDTLWNNIVFDNVDNISEEEVIELFDELNMTEWFSSLRNGFNTLLGERGCRLSSGQKQRLNIIRAILHMRYYPDDFVILDEITSNLDSTTEKIAISMLDRECKSTLIVISHHGDFGDICDNHIIVKNHEFETVVV